MIWYMGLGLCLDGCWFNGVSLSVSNFWGKGMVRRCWSLRWDGGLGRLGFIVIVGWWVSCFGRVGGFINGDSFKYLCNVMY